MFCIKQYLGKKNFNEIDAFGNKGKKDLTK